MNKYRADFHIHSVLSPCGDLDMSPSLIINEAAAIGLKIIAIADHNSTLHSGLAYELGKKKGITVFGGAEINSKEEVHCLTLFETIDQTNEFQKFINKHLPFFPNNIEKFGEQVLVDENEMIIEMVEGYLGIGLDVSLEVIEKEVHRLNGLFIPSHIDRPRNSLLSQLGFLPADLCADAFEISKTTNISEFKQKNKQFTDAILIKNSDAHYARNIGDNQLIFHIMEPSIAEIKMAFRLENSRYFELK